MKIPALLCSLVLVQACASNNAIKPEDRPLLSSVRLEHSKEAAASIDYRGKGSSFLSRVNVGIGVGVGVGTGGRSGVGVGAGVGTNLGREPSNELDRVALDNRIDIDDFMMQKFKARASDAGVVIVETAPKLTFTAHSTQLLFEGVVGNPTLKAEADFLLKEGNRVVWRHKSRMEGAGKDFPSYSHDELLKKENLRTALEKAAEILVDDAIKNLKTAVTAP